MKRHLSNEEEHLIMHISIMIALFTCLIILNSFHLYMTTTAQPQKCKVPYKGKDHNGTIIDSKADKLKVEILNSSGFILATDWYDKKQVKRQW